jgi:hypothetical protein
LRCLSSKYVCVSCGAYLGGRQHTHTYRRQHTHTYRRLQHTYTYLGYLGRVRLGGIRFGQSSVKCVTLTRLLESLARQSL